jgi:hypothetical protein
LQIQLCSLFCATSLPMFLQMSLTHLGHGNGSTVVVGKALLRLEEERPNESTCLRCEGHNESELTRCGTELMVRRSVAGSVGRGKWGRAWASRVGETSRNQEPAHRIASLGLERKEDDHQSCTWGMTGDYPKSGPDRRGIKCCRRCTMQSDVQLANIREWYMATNTWR